MNITVFCTQSLVLVVAGKGGIGKSTVSATLAMLAARNGLSVLRRVARRLAKSEMLDVVATALPGVRDILVLGKIVELERVGDARSDRRRRRGRRARHGVSHQRPRAVGLEPGGTYTRSGCRATRLGAKSSS
jgi:hypothetical protein